MYEASGTILSQREAEILLSFSRPLHLAAPQQHPVEASVDDLSDEFAFVPVLIIAIFVSLVPDTSILKRFFRQDWALEWRGWLAAARELNDSTDDAVSESVALDTIQNFCRIS